MRNFFALGADVDRSREGIFVCVSGIKSQSVCDFKLSNESFEFTTSFLALSLETRHYIQLLSLGSPPLPFNSDDPTIDNRHPRRITKLRSVLSSPVYTPPPLNQISHHRFSSSSSSQGRLASFESTPPGGVGRGMCLVSSRSKLMVPATVLAFLGAASVRANTDSNGYHSSPS